MANSVDPDQTAPIGAVCFGSTLFASILNSSVMLGNYLQQTTSADDIFRCFFGALMVKKSLAFSKFVSQLVWVCQSLDSQTLLSSRPFHGITRDQDSCQRLDL